ncbi:PRC-barrel domain-containing protein [Roseomonas sp. E05]|uniref:PRC-barrel domain-containing protein n=1 Tax=Roseomonas sp. E05 TaxID=3046310 RepID=UPI0024BA45BA|nr:PRC-barrel domain-containing protein [Roseomonas sp. E05]MDJ0387799.1 PRC-barrel domain-containing protein [Roseomonas sp. E05]
MRDTTLLSRSAFAALFLAPWMAAAQTTPGASQTNAPAQQQSGGKAQQQAQQQSGSRSQGQSGAPARQQASAGQQGVAQQCLKDLQAFRDRVGQDGYWLSGYRQGYGWGWAGGLAAAPAATMGGAAGGATPGSTAATAGNDAPWGDVNWRMAPARALTALQNAAIVMAHRGNEEGCQMVLGELRSSYDQYAKDLRNAGVEPGEVNSYRTQQLAAAKPVTQMQRGFRADDITDTDLRNPQDQYLGSVEDVVVNPSNGQIRYVVVERGGFLGIGEDYVAVPWNRLSATPQMDAFVLKAKPETLGQAPKVDPESFSSADGYAQQAQQIDSFWQQQTQGG